MTRARRGPATAPACEDLLVGQRLAAVAGPGIGHQRDAADLEADPARRDALEHGRHPDRVPAEPGEHPDLGRGLVVRPGQADVDPSASSTPSAAPAAWRRARSRGLQASVRSVNRGPSSSALRPDERVPAGQVDVVAHDHERARPERRIEAAGRVGQHDDPWPRGAWNSSTGWTTRPGCVALVEVEAALEHHDRPAAEAAEQQPPGVTGRRGGRPAGQVARTGSRPGPRGRRRARRGRTRARSRPRARARSGRGPRPTSAARRAGWSAGGMGAAGSTVDDRRRPDMRASRSASRGRRPRPADFVGPTEVSTPGCRSRPVGRDPRTGRGETATRRRATKRPKRPAADRRSLM